jgi:hypothetical protein
MVRQKRYKTIVLSILMRSKVERHLSHPLLESFFDSRRIPDALRSLKAPTSGAGITNHGVLLMASLVIPTPY